MTRKELIEERLKNFLGSMTDEGAKQLIETVDVLIEENIKETLCELKRFNTLLPL